MLARLTRAKHWLVSSFLSWKPKWRRTTRMCQVCLFYFLSFFNILFEYQGQRQVTMSTGLQTHYSVMRFCLVSWQILEPCLRLAKAVSWTTNSGYAMMRLSISLVETSILLFSQVNFIFVILFLLQLVGIWVIWNSAGLAPLDTKACM